MEVKKEDIPIMFSSENIEKKVKILFEKNEALRELIKDLSKM